MKANLIIGDTKQSNISAEALTWFYDKVKNGKPGPFIAIQQNSATNAIWLPDRNDNQGELF